MPRTTDSVHDWLVVIDRGCYSDRQIIGFRVPEWQARKLHELSKAVEKLIKRLAGDSRLKAGEECELAKAPNFLYT